MNFLITGVTGCRNHGVEALLCSIIEQIQVRDPHANITVATGDVLYDPFRLDKYGVKCIDHCRELIHSNLRPHRKIFEDKLGKDRYRLDPLKKAISECDAIIVTGGDVLASEYGLESLQFHLKIPEMGLKKGKPIVYLAHSIGPFKGEGQLETWNEAAAKASLITLRESPSYRYVTENLNSTSNIHRTADVAFLLAPDPAVESLVNTLNLDKDRPYVTCSTSQGISKFSNLSKEQHVEKWIKTISSLVQVQKTQVVLIPHVQERAPLHNDLTLATAIMKKLPADIIKDVRIMGGEYSASEYKTVISQSDMLIAERMHAAIAGLSTGVPTIVIGYSIKAEGILGDLLGKEWLGKGVLISSQDFLNTNGIRDNIDSIWSNREILGKQLDEARTRVKEEAGENFELLFKMLGKK